MILGTHRMPFVTWTELASERSAFEWRFRATGVVVSGGTSAEEIEDSLPADLLHEGGPGPVIVPVPALALPVARIGDPEARPREEVNFPIENPTANLFLSSTNSRVTL